MVAPGRAPFEGSLLRYEGSLLPDEGRNECFGARKSRRGPAEVAQKSRGGRAGGVQGPAVAGRGQAAAGQGPGHSVSGGSGAQKSRRSPAGVARGSRGEGPGPPAGVVQKSRRSPAGVVQGLAAVGRGQGTEYPRGFGVQKSRRSRAEVPQESCGDRAEIARGSRRDISTVFARFRGLFLTGFLTGKSVARSWA